MYRIDDHTSVTSLPPIEEAGYEGYFTEGDPAMGASATSVRASWLNMVQEELRNIVVAGGLTPVKGSHTQVLEALLAKFARRVAPAYGTADAISAVFNPPVTTLTDGMSVLVRAATANTGASPTFQADETEPKLIVKANDRPLVDEDIAGEGHWLELHFDARLDKWVLQNPARGLFVEKPLNYGVPVGTIEYFAMQTPPPGYLKADGTAVSRTAFVDLFAAIGTQFGAGNGSSTFNLPDLRGEFVRGWDAGRNVDVGRVFGSAQGDAIRNITASLFSTSTNPVDSFLGDGLGVSGAFKLVNKGSKMGIADTGAVIYGADALNLDASFVVPTADENRPRNIALLACIKAFDASVNPGLIDITALANEMADRVPYADFMGTNQSKTASGWQKLPGGMIIQWGQIPITSGLATEKDFGIQLFPIAFPNSTLCTHATITTGDNFGSSDSFANVYQVTNTGIGIVAGSNVAGGGRNFGVYWFVIGH